MVTSWMKISAALANMMGASAEIIFTSSSSFMIFLMRANGNSGFLKSAFVFQIILELVYNYNRYIRWYYLEYSTGWKF